MKIKCDFCHKTLKHLGALLFSPPNKNGYVKKYHACVDCYKRLTPTQEG